jgi:hypothetical protein
MKTCRTCGAQLDDNAKFCRYCGKPAEDTQSFQNTGNMYGNQNTGNMYGNQNTGNMYGNQGYPYYGGYQPVQEKKTNGFAIASLVLSLVGIIVGWLAATMLAAGSIVGGMTFVAILLYAPSALGILFGIAGIAKSNQPGYSGKGLAIAGLVIGIIFFLVWLYIGITAASVVNSYVGPFMNTDYWYDW